MSARQPRPIDADLAARIAGQVAEIKRLALTRAAAVCVLQADYKRRYEWFKRERER
jgi:hypothetical protein